MTTSGTRLAARNGQGPFAKNTRDSQPRFVRNGRDLAACVHTDQAFEAFYSAAIRLGANGAPAIPGNPYLKLMEQSGFVTFCGPHFLCLLGVALSILADKREIYGEEFAGFAMRRFDGTNVTV